MENRRTDLHQLAYPDDLCSLERRILEKRRKAIDRRSPAGSAEDDRIGLALSGGGIRSATFGLGLLQSLASLRLLKNVDYLSTVSGGGYLGAFFGRLFTREIVSKAGDVEAILTSAKEPRILGFLRENGRYLSPNGAGDLLLGGAALLRNWVALHVVLSTLFLALFLLAEVLQRLALIGSGAAASSSGLARLQEFFLPGAGLVWPSMWILVPAMLGGLAVVPLGWAYWMVAKHDSRWVSPLVGLLLFIALSIAVAASTSLIIGAGLVLVGVSVLFWTVWSAGRAIGSVSPGESCAFRRNLLSRWLCKWLVVTASFLAFALIDTLGQSIYKYAEGSNQLKWGAGLLSVLAGVGAFAQKIAVMGGSKVRGKRPTLPVSIIATIAAFLIVGCVLVGLNVLAHAISWKFEAVDSVQAQLKTGVSETRELLRSSADGHSIALQLVHDHDPVPRESKAWQPTTDDVRIPALACAVACIFSVLFGRTWSFLNMSSHQQLYSARLTRAYLGASNPERLNRSSPRGPGAQKNEQATLSNVVPGDDVALGEYWMPDDPEKGAEARGNDEGAPTVTPTPAPPKVSPYTKGAPIHLINVTINETIDGKSQIQQQDRRGTGMALGPGGISIGVRHHAVFTWGKDKSPPSYLPPGANAFLGFDGEQKGPVPFPEERLQLGAWVGISGAAFSTGLGSRTSLGLSLLCGMGNVRLGYWWTPGVRRPFKGLWDALLQLGLPVQTYLLSEFVSRFRGTAGPQWYLSDGGHFENMGAYELVRRRLPRICVVDAEADADYTFEGLANLVRKARIDFGGEIHFLGREELDQWVHRDYRQYFGTLEQLRRGTWTSVPIQKEAGPAERDMIETADPERDSVAHAALAWITYEGEQKPSSWLLYIKPTLTGDEPSDVVRYHSEHPSFPHESTIDQFFDEAQWESYRRLGEHIGQALFQRHGQQEVAEASPPAKAGVKQWRPCDFFGGEHSS